MSEREKYTVREVYPDGGYTVVGRDLPAKEAVETAHRVTQKPAVLLGIIVRVMITDEDDCCVFMWEHDKGVVYPTREERKPNDRNEPEA